MPLYRTMFGMWTIYNYHFTSCTNSTEEAYYEHDVKAIGLTLPSRAVIAKFNIGPVRHLHDNSIKRTHHAESFILQNYATLLCKVKRSTFRRHNFVYEWYFSPSCDCVHLSSVFTERRSIVVQYTRKRWDHALHCLNVSTRESVSTNRRFKTFLWIKNNNKKQHLFRLHKNTKHQLI